MNTLTAMRVRAGTERRVAIAIPESMGLRCFTEGARDTERKCNHRTDANSLYLLVSPAVRTEILLWQSCQGVAN